MVESDIRAIRKGLKGDRVAICPKYACHTLEKLKPLKPLEGETGDSNVLSTRKDAYTLNQRIFQIQ